jgi:hypothetical protein
MKPQSYERKILRRHNANTPVIKNLNARVANMEASQNVCLCVTLETSYYLREISIFSLFYTYAYSFDKPYAAAFS